MSKLQMTNLRTQYDSIKSDVDRAIQEAIDSSGFILGKQVELFENEAAAYHGVKYAVGVASGTDALVLALAALGIGKGDEVITTPFTFIATAEAVSRVGAKPVFCDIQPDTYNIDPDKIEAKITGRTKAILPVHLYGMPCDMAKIMAIAKKHGLKVIEDCAQSFGSEFEGKKTGAIGDAGCLSFFPAKTLGCFGDGGMVVTNDLGTAERLKVLRNHGSTKKYYYSMHGFNSRLDTLQAAILLVKIRHVDGWIASRIKSARLYNELLSKIHGITVPAIPKGSKHSFNYYTMRVTAGRDKLQDELKDKGIPTMIYYPVSLHLQDVYKDLGHKPGDFPVSEKAQAEVLSLPMCPELKEDQIREVVRGIIQ